MTAEIQKHSETIASRLTETLTEAIVCGEIPAGKKLSEPDLARRFDVSRGPLREALRRLEGRGLVHHVPHSGARVVTLERDEILELSRVREALEGMAARLAAERMSDAEIDELSQLLDEHEKTVERTQGREYFQQEGDLDFHYRIVKGSRNPKLIALLCGDLYHLVRMYRYQASKNLSRPQKALAEHRRVVEAIAERDGELAELLIRRHLSASRASIADHLEDQDALGESSA